MKKRVFSLALALLMALSLLPAASAAAPKVVLSPQRLSVNDKTFSCEKYNIDGANYFKLRDLAKLLSGTASQFAVGYDEASKTISVTTGKPYTAVGGELDAGTDHSASAVVSAQKLLIDGRAVTGLSVYNIGGSNFFKLRDLGSQLGFRVDYDAASNTALVFSRDFSRVSADYAVPAMSQGAMQAYLGVLTANREDILHYNWQMGLDYNENTEQLTPVATAAPVTFADVWGDQEPELIFLTAEEHGGLYIVATLHVYTFEKSGARELLSQGELDGQAGGGGNYRLFQAGTDKGLWLYNVYYGESSSGSYRHYAASGEMKPALTCSFSSWPDWDENYENATIHTEYKLNGKECAQAEYDAAVPADTEQAKGLLMRNAMLWEYSIAEPDDGAFSYPLNPALTCDAAIAHLREKLGLTSEKVDETLFFASLPDFAFLSGAGGWSTELSIACDGTFEGDFHDGDMGDSGPGYPNGTIYVCNFYGRFGNVKRVDDYTYSMRMLELKVEPTDSEEWIEDDIRYVASGPYGLENADEILVYLPGAWLETLPEDFVDWISMPRAWGFDERPLLLPCYGLYNVAEKEGFGSYGQSAVYAEWAENLLPPVREHDEFAASTSGQPASFVLAANETVTDVKLYDISLKSVDDYGTPKFSEKEIYRQAELTPERPLLVKGSFPGDTPNYGVSFQTKDGETHRFAIGVSGKDGSLFLTRY